MNKYNKIKIKLFYINRIERDREERIIYKKYI